MSTFTDVSIPNCMGLMFFDREKPARYLCELCDYKTHLKRLFIKHAKSDDHVSKVSRYLNVSKVSDSQQLGNYIDDNVTTNFSNSQKSRDIKDHKPKVLKKSRKEVEVIAVDDETPNPKYALESSINKHINSLVPYHDMSHEEDGPLSRNLKSRSHDINYDEYFTEKTDSSIPPSLTLNCVYDESDEVNFKYYFDPKWIYEGHKRNIPKKYNQVYVGTRHLPVHFGTLVRLRPRTWLNGDSILHLVNTLNSKQDLMQQYLYKDDETMRTVVIDPFFLPIWVYIGNHIDPLNTMISAMNHTSFVIKIYSSSGECLCQLMWEISIGH